MPTGVLICWHHHVTEGDAGHRRVVSVCARNTLQALSSGGPLGPVRRFGHRAPRVPLRRRSLTPVATDGPHPVGRHELAGLYHPRLPSTVCLGSRIGRGPLSPTCRRAVYLIACAVVYVGNRDPGDGIDLPVHGRVLAAGVAAAVAPPISAGSLSRCVAAFAGDLTGYWIGFRASAHASCHRRPVAGLAANAG